MAGPETIPFFEVFSAYQPMSGELFAVLTDTVVTAMSVSEEEQAIRTDILPTQPMTAAMIQAIQRELAAAYGVTRAVLRVPKELVVAPKPGKTAAKGKGAPRVQTVLGTVNTKRATPIGDLNLDMGSIAVEGEVFSTEFRQMKNRTNCMAIFQITDYTGSVRVKKFMTTAESKPVSDAVTKGVRVRVQGNLKLDKYDNDLILEPAAIAILPSKGRADAAPEKRVELHLHTTMSAMDALVNVKEAVKRAADWGHPAIAITDHGVAHAFPDAASAAKGRGIKVIYGVEAYFENNLDADLPVSGPEDRALSGPIVVFDVETTGLRPRRDSLIEIGAVVVENGKLTGERFSTFVDPVRPIPAKIRSLTGIHDGMLRGAPEEAEAVRAFLDFVGDRPVAAHNAAFDIGFISAAAGRLGRSFLPVTLDTLNLARRLYPEMPNHKLDTLAGSLNLGDFTHHRAVDDAMVTARLLLLELEQLRGKGVESTGQVNTYLAGGGGKVRARRSYRHIILLARNQTGLRNLYKLISLAHLEHFHRFPVMSKTLIQENREGLILGSACEAGELFSAVVAGRADGELLRIADWYDYLEIQPRSNNAFLLRPDKNGEQAARDEEELLDFNRTVCRLGMALNKPVCATGDVHFLDPHEEIYRRILLHSKGFDDADSENPLYFRTTDEMLEEFSYLGKEKAHEVVITNPNLVADWCEEVSPLPKGLFIPKLENSAEELSELVWGRAAELYGSPLPALVEERVNAELGDILRCKYDVIYMSAQKLVQDSLKNGYLVGSRGSVGSSIVAYLAGITEVNSLPSHYRCPACRHSDFEAGRGFGCGADMPDAACSECGAAYAKDGFDIPFETFLGFGGDKVPDIDLNFSGEYQANAHRHTFALLGEHHVFRAGTIGTVAEKTAFGYVKKYLEARDLKVSHAEENRLAQGCTGVKRTTGQHPGGMVVIPRDKEIYDFCPVQRPADDKDSDIITTHFEYHSMESNLLKLDILGHDDPSMMRMLQDLTGVDPQGIPLDDPDTMSIFTSSAVLGYEDDKVLGPTGACAIPEFGTGFVRQMLGDTEPTAFSTLIRISGFSHGTDVWLGNAKDLILSGTAGVGAVIGCRDDIMNDLIGRGMEAKRAFQVMESVRKGRGLPAGAEEEMRRAGVPDWYITSCKKIKYLFPKAHAVAYVLMGFRIAWFKVHRPLAFYAAYFTIRAKAFDVAVMCMGMGMVKAKKAELERKDKLTGNEQDMLTTLEVCYEFYLRGFRFDSVDLYRSDATRFVPDNERGALLPPLTSVAGLGDTAAQSIVDCRRPGEEFLSVAEFTAACPKVTRAHVEGLRAAGALTDMPESSQMSLF